MSGKDEWAADVTGEMAAISKARSEDPSSLLVEILRHYWLESTAEEAEHLWRTTVRDQPAYAIDALNCLYTITEHPPPDLVELIQQQGGVIFYARHGDRSEPFSATEYRSWLREVHDHWHDIFTAARPR